jgi:hypothetical protein
MSCNNLILYYDTKSTKTSLTDIISLSTGAKKRNILQLEHTLFNKEGIIQGTVNSINDICIYESTPNITNTINNRCYTIIKDTFIEKYSVVSSDIESRDSSGFINENSVKFFNLTSVEGNPSYTKLKWIVPVDEQGKPLTRTLVFYN